MNISEEELNKFIGKDPDYYLEKFKDLEIRNTVFNVFAFFGGILWTFYRKMYLYGFIIMGIITLEAILEDVILDLTGTTEKYGQILNFYVSVLIFFLIGFYGNSLYKKHVYNQIKNIKEKNIDESTYHEKLRKKGGVTYVPLIIFLFLIAAAVVLSEQ